MVKIVNSDLASGKAGKRSGKVKGVVIHNDYGAMTPEEYITWLNRRKAAGKLGLGYAHYYIDKDTIVRVDHTYNKAWHTGNNDGNANYLGYEVVESFYGVISDAEFIENENMTLRQAAEDLAYYGLPVNRDTVRLHNEFKATSCPHRSWDIHVGKGKSFTSANKNIMKDYFISKIKAYQNLGKTVQEMLKNEGVKDPVKVETPKATGTHKVVKGDTLWDIAIKYNTSVSNIKSLNNLKSDLINVGQVLKVNGTVKSVTETIKKPAAVKKTTPAKPAAKKYPLPDATYWVKKPLFSGTGVRQVQEALASIYFYPEKGAKNNGVDGYYGAKTADAVKRFQSVNGLKADGDYGPATKKVLDKKVNK